MMLALLWPSAEAFNLAAVTRDEAVEAPDLAPDLIGARMVADL
jgi:hypothetical protein